MFAKAARPGSNLVTETEKVVKGGREYLLTIWHGKHSQPGACPGSRHDLKSSSHLDRVIVLKTNSPATIKKPMPDGIHDGESMPNFQLRCVQLLSPVFSVEGDNDEVVFFVGGLKNQATGKSVNRANLHEKTPVLAWLVQFAVHHLDHGFWEVDENRKLRQVSQVRVAVIRR